MNNNSNLKDNLRFLDNFIFVPSGMKPSNAYHHLHFISRKDFLMFRENIICLSNACLIKEKGNTQLVYYDIDWIGKNVICDRKDGHIILNLSRTKNKFVLLVVKMEDISMIEMKHLNTSKFKSDRRIKNTNGSGYLLLMICCDSFQVDFDSSNDLKITQSDIDVTKLTSINQVRKQGKMHFGTYGHVYSFGYTAKYDKINENLNSFAKFTTSKLYDLYI